MYIRAVITSRKNASFSEAVKSSLNEEQINKKPLNKTDEKEKKCRHIATYEEIIEDFSQDQYPNVSSFWKKENTVGRMKIYAMISNLFK